MSKTRQSLGRLSSQDDGFTLMELLIVLAILGLLATFAVPRVIQFLSTAKADTADVQIESLESALEFYFLDTGTYPTSADGLQALIRQPDGVARWNGPYVNKAEGLTDPWGTPYNYRFPGEHGTYDIFSFGADNAEGGEGEAADVTNW